MAFFSFISPISDLRPSGFFFCHPNNALRPTGFLLFILQSALSHGLFYISTQSALSGTVIQSFSPPISKRPFLALVINTQPRSRSTFDLNTAKATIDVCEEDWDDYGEADFCGSGPFDFRVPEYAGIVAIAHVRARPLERDWTGTGLVSAWKYRERESARGRATPCSSC